MNLEKLTIKDFIIVFLSIIIVIMSIMLFKGNKKDNEPIDYGEINNERFQGEVVEGGIEFNPYDNEGRIVDMYATFDEAEAEEKGFTNELSTKYLTTNELDDIVYEDTILYYDDMVKDNLQYLVKFMADKNAKVEVKGINVRESDDGDIIVDFGYSNYIDMIAGEYKVDLHDKDQTPRTDTAAYEIHYEVGYEPILMFIEDYLEKYEKPAEIFIYSDLSPVYIKGITDQDGLYINNQFSVLSNTDGLVNIDL